MPCLGPTTEEWNAERRAKGTLAGEREFEAVLCGLLSAMRDTHGAAAVDGWLDAVDWKEVGVPRKRVAYWWAAHQMDDARRRYFERLGSEEARARSEALAKLTPAERKALGVDDGE